MTRNTIKNKPLLLGCIADDITGATDLGLMLASHGLPTTLFLGIPRANQTFSTEAVVIALKTRTIDARDAVAQATTSADWLLTHSARQLFFKYCSTFDSTVEGNIGPVTDALLDRVDSDITVLLPAFPENGRTVRGGHLYVDGVPLSESSMRNHPLTPMTDSFIPRLMDAQTESGLTTCVDQNVVGAGVDAIAHALDEARAGSFRYVCIDTLSDDDLQPISDAVSGLPLLTGGSGIAGAIPSTLREHGLLDSSATTTDLPKLSGYAAIMAGSCSKATRGQIELIKDVASPILIDPLALDDGRTDKHAIAEMAITAAADNDVLVYSSTDPSELRRIQDKLGIAKSAALVEDTIAYVASRLAESGISKFIVAGGETSGAVAHALSINELQVAAQIDPGVPWMVTPSEKPVCLAFKSGNFGRPDFFQHALEMLP